MKQTVISDALNFLDDAIIEEANSVRMHKQSSEVTQMPPHKRSRQIRRTLILAAIITVSLTLCGFGAYVYWHMPDKGEAYTGDRIQTHKTSTYPLPDQNITTDNSSQPATAPSKFSDAWFMEQAVYVLNTVNKQDTDASKLIVTRQTNQQWSREEVVISFSDSENRSSDVKFDAESGCLIEVVAFDKEIIGDTPMSEPDALAIAQNFYDVLPYARDYIFTYVEKFDDHAWSFHFDKPIELELWGETGTLYSAYEQVRIVIDPCSGTFQLSNCFYVPLLDEHAAEAKPITQEEAVAIVEANKLIAKDPSSYTLDAKIGICLPKPGEMSWYNNSEDYTPENYKYYSITRLGWILNFESEPNEYGMITAYHICIDLYTGEVLSLDMAG